MGEREKGGGGGKYLGRNVLKMWNNFRAFPFFGENTQDLLKILQRKLAIKCAHSQRSHAEIFSNPTTVDLHSLDNQEKDFEHSVFCFSSNQCSVSLR